MIGDISHGYYLMSKPLFVIILLTLNFSLWSQTISGHLQGLRDEPVIGMVFIDGTGIKAETDSKGYYKTGAIKPGTYKVVAFVPGYETTYQTVSMNSENKNLMQGGIISNE